MVQVKDDLGRRIVQAVRLAVELHTGAADASDDLGQRVRIGALGWSRGRQATDRARGARRRQRGAASRAGLEVRRGHDR